LLLAIALVDDPALLFLDELTTASTKRCFEPGRRT
jgi:hypothetical protein